MSSIERYIDKLGKDAVEAGVATQAPSVSEQASPASETTPRATTRQHVEIDFGLLHAAGMLTPETAQGGLADEYRAIKRPLLKNAFGRGAVEIDHGNLIMITSALPGEGKTFTSINLAVSMAMELDRTVLLVEGDVAKPAVCRYCGIPEPEYGLVDYLADSNMDLSDLLMKTNVPKLTILPAGRRHPSSAELLASAAMESLMDELANRYPDRVVLFDAPPLLLSNEAVTLSSYMGQIVVVIEAARTPQEMVKEALALLDENQVVGVILNKNRSSAQAYGYGYGYGATGRGA